MATYDYDMFIIGSGPAGQRAAIQAAKLGKKVAICERNSVLGGAAINTGTIPSKTLREAVMFLSGYRQREIYGSAYSVKQDITIEDLLYRTQHVIRHEVDVANHQIMRNRIERFLAHATFVDPHTLCLAYADESGQREVTAEFIVIATGSLATRSDDIPFDGERIFTSDDILQLDELPRRLTIIGAGVIGCEYAGMFAALGVRVTLVNKHHRLLEFVDAEITDALIHNLRQNRATLRLGEEVRQIEKYEDDRGKHVRIHLDSGKKILTEKVLYSIGRTGATKKLKVEAAGLELNSRGRFDVNENFQTNVPHIYAAGDVIGFPSLASTSMEQGRLAAAHAFGLASKRTPELVPYGIYTIPEISTCGRTEEELTDEGIPYEIGKADYREIARGQIIGDNTGLLKLIFHIDTLELLGVHIIGDGATELVHIGQAVLAAHGKIDYFIDTVFNYPTLAEAYKIAAFDGMNRMS
ncbi:MAG: Si-specific NAD(P)(+) transhydrogenase [SAR324 cluster bacterium]|nr:Si-specific NAD(P)(+) transhydrogenase [SAR324 cluster bacterium]